MSLLGELPAYGLANTATGFATLFSGLTCLALSRWVHRHPRRWELAYWTIVVTGVFTVTLHGLGETLAGFGPRWFWGFLDTGSNIVVAWALARAVLGDYYREHRWARGAVLIASLAGVGWHFVDRLPSTPRSYLVHLGEWGGFYPGETWLIGLSLLVGGLFAARWNRIPERARPILLWVLAVFLVGMLLASARNDTVLFPALPLHALWHLVGAFGFVCLWAFNHVRFTEPARGLPIPVED